MIISPYLNHRMASFAGFGASCPPKTKYVQGKGCCIPMGLSASGRRQCCAVKNTHVCGPNCDGKYWMNCKTSTCPPPAKCDTTGDTGGDGGGDSGGDSGGDQSGNIQGTAGGGGGTIYGGDTGGSGFDISTYLPYILIGGGALILISLLTGGHKSPVASFLPVGLATGAAQ
jgi:hypothetical protein